MIKALIEKRNDLHEKMENILNLAKFEARALTAEETAQFEDFEKQIKDLDDTIARMEKFEKNRKKNPVEDDTQEAKDIKAFANYIRGIKDESIPVKKDENGALIPTTIANKIIDRVYEISPIFQMGERYNVKGTLTIPYIDQEQTTLTMTYADEFTEAESGTVVTKSITLNGFLGRALALVSQSLINNSDFDIVNVVVNKMAKEIAKFIEHEVIVGTDGKIEGLKGVTKEIECASATAITADELIDLQEEVPDVYQAEAIWIMNKETRKAIRKLKNSDGDYLLQRDFTSKWGYILLGKDVYISESMPTMGAGNVAAYYGDMSGLAIKVSENISTNILTEKYADQHAIGVLAFVEMDSKVQDAAKIAKLVGKRG